MTDTTDQIVGARTQGFQVAGESWRHVGRSIVPPDDVLNVPVRRPVER